MQCTDCILDLCMPRRGKDLGGARPKLSAVHLFGAWVGILNFFEAGIIWVSTLH